MAGKNNKQKVRDAVKRHYADAIKLHTACCPPPPTELDIEGGYSLAKLSGYSRDELESVPETVTSFGCGNPVALADLQPGEVVLDLGAGAGLDLILAARKVGESGRVIGLDMTPEMIDVCRANLQKAGIENAEVRPGQMEDMPVADAEVDWIISNCVINLSPEKHKVFAEAYRVLKPGGKMMISDMVTHDLPDEYRDDMAAWVGCLAGALEEGEYVRLVEKTGFADVKVVDKLVYTAAMLAGFADEACCCGSQRKTASEGIVDRYADRVAAVKLFARKPG
ncbi:MAG: arsenite methyltransferase [candidate division Zixibacteria bacterium]|nr:arsenite methyltransferase [candidate division Zixibacteria bacterium]